MKFQVNWSRVNIFTYSVGNFGTFCTRFITGDHIDRAGFNQAVGVTARGYGMLMTGEGRLVRGRSHNIGWSHFVDMFIKYSGIVC